MKINYNKIKINNNKTRIKIKLLKKMKNNTIENLQKSKIMFSQNKKLNKKIKIMQIQIYMIKKIEFKLVKKVNQILIKIKIRKNRSYNKKLNFKIKKNNLRF